MRLVKAEFHGFGRLADGKVNLDNKVVAIVGPNEAGKSTLLRALAYIDNGATLSPSERSRGLNIGDGAVVSRVQYVLDDADREAVNEYNLEEPPRSLWISRTAAAEHSGRGEVDPPPRKAVGPLIAAIKKVRAAHSTKVMSELAYSDPKPDADGNLPTDDVHASLAERAEAVLFAFLEEAEGGDVAAVANNYGAELREVRDAAMRYGVAEALTTALSAVLEWIDREDPANSVATVLCKRSPRILLFSDQDRTLDSSYPLSAELVANPPASLANLVGLAELDLRQLWATYASGDEGERETLIDEANRTLAPKFAAAWKQSSVTVVLKTEHATLFIRIKQDGRRITQFDERSAGLKMFVALVAFLAVRDEQIQTPPVLLIDEAETHLHIDAQVDLVNSFMTQQHAAKIIYTTHSPACLPPDLGSNIRAVVPHPTLEYRSVIQGSFWGAAAGFSPLLLAMGAGAAAFSTARYVVLGEGASEMLALPTLIKRAIGVADLEYQVAPGLSEVPPEMYPELDLVGARVAYLVDGDPGGLERRSSLIAGGVPAERIITLGALTLENLLDPDPYVLVIAKLLTECNPGAVVPEIPPLPDATVQVWPKYLDRWASEHGLKMPGKRVVASRLVEEGQIHSMCDRGCACSSAERDACQREKRGARPSSYGLPILKQLHREIERILMLPGTPKRSVNPA